MGYAYYDLPDGREAGYGVEAVCDHPDCKEEIDRGLDYLCGKWPLGHTPPRFADYFGCGNYFCWEHIDCHLHDCSRPSCASYSPDGDLYCQTTANHKLPHYDYDALQEFTKTEDS